MYLQVQSMTDAVRLKRQIKKRGIPAEVIQTPGRRGNGGCSFSVRIPDRFLSEGEKTAKEAGIRILSASGSGDGCVGTF